MNVFSATSYYSPNNNPDTFSLHLDVFCKLLFYTWVCDEFYHAYFYILQILYLSQNIVHKGLNNIIWQ